MSRKCRRKTRSHAEIENFLCDLNDEEPEVTKRSLSEVVVEVPEASSSSDCENPVPEDDLSSTRAQQEEEDEGRKYRASVVRAFHEVVGVG